MNFKATSLQPFGLLVEPLTSKAPINQLDMKKMRELFKKEQLLVLRGFETFKSADEFSGYCELWGEVSLWPFGKVLELVEQKKPEDHIFDNNYVPLHWDGMYRPQVPEIQIFHCVSAPGEDHGGRTTFSHTGLALEKASPEQIQTWSKVTGVYERSMEYYTSKTLAPIVTQHPTRGYSVIRYCEPPVQGDESFVNHPHFEFHGTDEVSKLIDELKDSLYSPENFYAHHWQTGDIVISDNHTLLHGREAFTSGAPRHLRRVHVLGEPALDNPHLVSHK